MFGSVGNKIWQSKEGRNIDVSHTLTGVIRWGSEDLINFDFEIFKVSLNYTKNVQ